MPKTSNRGRSEIINSNDQQRGRKKIFMEGRKETKSGEGEKEERERERQSSEVSGDVVAGKDPLHYSG